MEAIVLFLWREMRKTFIPRRNPDFPESTAVLRTQKQQQSRTSVKKHKFQFFDEI